MWDDEKSTFEKIADEYIFTGNGGTVVRNIRVVHRARHSLSVPESDGTVVSGLRWDGTVCGSPAS